MTTTAYLIRHAQSHPSSSLPEHAWPLSELGRRQSERLGALLEPLGIIRLHSSPYIRCLGTIGPFARRRGIEIVANDGLRERNIAGGVVDNFKEIWLRSWQDFSFSLPGCETSFEAQRRFLGAIRRILQRETGVIGISTHGAVLALLLNHLDSGYGPDDADQLMNPDVLKLDFVDGELSWDRAFRLPGIDAVATHHAETPIDW